MSNSYFAKCCLVDALPREAINTTPSPIPSGAPIFKNFSLGAQTEMAERPGKHVSNGNGTAQWHDVL